MQHPTSTVRAAAPAAVRGMAAALALALAACGGEDGPAAEGGEDDGNVAEARTAAPSPPSCEELASLAPDSMETTETGLRILEREEGDGREAAEGDTVAVHYVGCLTDGTRFDASYERNEPIEFPLGAGRVIAGWDEGVAGMRPGDVRVLRIPPELGYGSRGTPGGPIPPDATLIFHVRLTDVRPGPGDASGPG